jgi:hypothetical protein
MFGNYMKMLVTRCGRRLGGLARDRAKASFALPKDPIVPVTATERDQ